MEPVEGEIIPSKIEQRGSTFSTVDSDETCSEQTEMQPIEEVVPDKFAKMTKKQQNARRMLEKRTMADVEKQQKAAEKARIKLEKAETKQLEAWEKLNERMRKRQIKAENRTAVDMKKLDHDADVLFEKEKAKMERKKLAAEKKKLKEAQDRKKKAQERKEKKKLKKQRDIMSSFFSKPVREKKKEKKPVQKTAAVLTDFYPMNDLERKNVTSPDVTEERKIHKKSVLGSVRSRLIIPNTTTYIKPFPTREMQTIGEQTFLDEFKTYADCDDILHQDMLSSMVNHFKKSLSQRSAKRRKFTDANQPRSFVYLSFFENKKPPKLANVAQIRTTQFVHARKPLGRDPSLEYDYDSGMESEDIDVISDEDEFAGMSDGERQALLAEEEQEKVEGEKFIVEGEHLSEGEGSEDDFRAGMINFDKEDPIKAGELVYPVGINPLPRLNSIQSVCGYCEEVYNIKSSTINENDSDDDDDDDDLMTGKARAEQTRKNDVAVAKFGRLFGDMLKRNVTIIESINVDQFKTNKTYARKRLNTSTMDKADIRAFVEYTHKAKAKNVQKHVAAFHTEYYAGAIHSRRRCAKE
ncbi:hypothetical protein PCE1_004273 [Barthelona sp. PCE]